MSWSALIEGRILDIALRKRREVQLYCGRRFVPGSVYIEACGIPDGCGEFSSVGNATAVWKAVKKSHPDARLIRVRVEVIGG